MKFGINIVDDIVCLMEAVVKAGEEAVTTAMPDAETGLKTAWRAQITGAGLGARLARTILVGAVPERQDQPQCGGAGLVEGAGHRRCA